MPQFQPFRGILYRAAAAGDCSDVTTPPYDVIDAEQHARLEAQHNNSAIHLILPRGGDDRYQAAAERFRDWRESGVLLTDPEPRFYGYRMTFVDDGVRRTTTGVIGALALDARAEGRVLPHEQTMPKPKGDRLDLIRATHANLEPIWGLSLASGLSELAAGGGPPLARCVDEEGVEHEVFAIDEPDRIDAVRAAVTSAPVVIADGHHRYETACNYQAERRAHGAGDGPHDRIMTLVVELTEAQLAVRPIHRLLAGVPIGFDLRGALAAAFDVHDAGSHEPDAIDALVARMRDEGGLGLVEPERLALLVPRPMLAVERDIDAARFDTGVLPALAGLPALDVTYRHDRGAVAELVRKGAFDAAVLLRPVPVATIRAVAEAGERMPPKTTFFHPKPRTGLLFRSLDDG